MEKDTENQIKEASEKPKPRVTGVITGIPQGEGRSRRPNIRVKVTFKDGRTGWYSLDRASELQEKGLLI